eukprot:7546902-Lingulodinium_polyedra.AAC.1
MFFGAEETHRERVDGGCARDYTMFGTRWTLDQRAPRIFAPSLCRVVKMTELIGPGPDGYSDEGAR